MTTGMFGGLWLPEYETVLDDAAAAATGDVTDDTPAVDDAAAAETAIEDTPAASSWDDPAFIELAERAERLEARLAELTGNQPAQAEQPEINLDPFDESFGPNLISHLERIVNQAVGPIQQQIGSAAEQQAAERGEQIIDSTLDAAGVTRDDARAAARELAQAYLPGMERRHGAGNPRAADAALERAVQTVKGLAAGERQAGGQAEIDRLAQVAGAAGQPAGGGGAIVNPAPASSPAELLARTFGTPTNL